MLRHRDCSPHRRGFTLVELLVVIAIIGILVGMLFPAIQAVREAARRSACSNNIRQIMIATHNYESAFGKFPRTIKNPAWGDTGAYQYWGVYVLPYIEQQNVADLYDWNYACWDVENQEAVSQSIPVFHCSSAPQAQLVEIWDPVFGHSGDYVAVEECVSASGDYHFSGIVSYDSATSNVSNGDYRSKNIRVADIRDGLSNTIFFTENAAAFDHYVKGKLVASGSNPGGSFRAAWSYTRRIWVTGFEADGETPFYSANAPCLVNCSNHSWGGIYAFHPGGAMFAFGDSSVQFIDQNIDGLTLFALCTRRGGEVVSEY